MILYTYIVPGQFLGMRGGGGGGGRGAGADNSNGVNFEHHRKLFSLGSFAVSFRRTDLNSNFT